MKSETADFMEIFGSSSVAESLNADAPLLAPASAVQLPTDNSLWEFLDVPIGKAARSIQDEEFVREISGFEPVPVPQEPAPDLSLESPAVDDFIKRTSRVLTNARAHRQAMRTAVDHIRNLDAFARVRDNPHWDSLTSACTTFVAGELVAASGA